MKFLPTGRGLEAMGTRVLTPEYTELVIFNAQLTHSGDYTCHVGPVSKITTIIVSGEGEFIKVLL